MTKHLKAKHKEERAQISQLSTDEGVKAQNLGQQADEIGKHRQYRGSYCESSFLIGNEKASP